MARARAVRFKQHDGTTWAVRWTTLAGGRKFRKCPDRRTADDLALEINQHLALGREWSPQPTRGRALVEDLTADFIADRSRSLRPRTLKRYGKALDLFERFLHERSPDTVYVDQLERSTLAGFWAWLRDPTTSRHAKTGKQVKPRSEETCKKHIEVTQLLWAWAFESDRYAAETPRPKVLDMPERVVPLPRAPTWPECDRMIAELRQEWHRRAAILLRMIGGRIEETLLLDWRDVDLDARFLTLQPETTKAGKSGRTIPMSKALAEEMAGWGKRSGRVVGAPERETKGRGHVGRDFARAWKRAGVRPEAYTGQPTHAFRKAMETELASLAVDQRVIDVLTGHKPQGTGGRHYRDPRAFQAALAEAVEMVAPIGSQTEAERGSGLASVPNHKK